MLFNIKDLEVALGVRKYFNRMDFKDFVEMVKKDPKYDITLFDPDQFEFTGLSNVDYLNEVLIGSPKRVVILEFGKEDKDA